MKTLTINCDRCRREVKTYYAVELSLGGEILQEYELCDVCRCALTKFMRD